MSTSLRPPVVHAAVEQLARLEQLDAPAQKVAKSVRDNTPKGPVKDALSGTWLGHTLHPLLTDVPIGTWTSAVLLDWLGGRKTDRAAERLIGIGLAASVPAWITGMQEWADTEPASPSVRRIGVIHATANIAAVGLFGASLAARRSGARGGGKLLALMGAGMVGVSGHLGGHLSYAEGVGVDQTAFEDPPEDWAPVMREGELAEGEARYAEVHGVGVLVVRHDGELAALSNRCTHRGGALDEGEIADGCVTCPLHGSVFRLTDGGVLRGPAAYPQPVWQVRVREGVVELKAPQGP